VSFGRGPVPSRNALVFGEKNTAAPPHLPADEKHENRSEKKYRSSTIRKKLSKKKMPA
jgi:hypothetical protein